MQKLKKLSRHELDHHFKGLVQKERELLHEVLLALKEIDARRIYLELGFPSLFAYLTEGIGYSGGGAQRRIDAARLMSEIPEVGEALRSGEIKLTQVALVQRAVRETKKSQSPCPSKEEVHGLIESLKHVSHRDSQQQVADFFGLPIFRETKIAVQADGSVRIEATLSAEQFELLTQAQELSSHALRSNDIVDFISYVSRRIVRQKKGGNSGPGSSAPATATVAVAALAPRRKIQRFKVQDGCEYRDPESGRRCGSRWHLQMDHIRPRWAQGGDESQNLQLLCGPHNRMKYAKEAGIRPMA